MANSARRKAGRSAGREQLVEKFMQDTDVHSALAVAAEELYNQIFLDSKNATHYRGYVGQRIYHDGTYALERALSAQLGFGYNYNRGRHQLVCATYGEENLSLVIHSGVGYSQTVRFNWPKRMSTFKDILENRQNRRRQLPLFPSATEPLPDPLVRWNLGIVCSMTKERARMWLFFGTGFKTRQVLECTSVVKVFDYVKPVSRRPDIAGQQDSLSNGFNDPQSSFDLLERPTPPE